MSPAISGREDEPMPRELDSHTGSGRPTVYQVRVRGQLDPQWADWFEEMAITPDDGDTLITGPAVDQAALHGVLKRLRDLGVPLVSVGPVGTGGVAASTTQKESPVMTTPRPTVRLATIEDAEPIADLLADAFLDYEWSRWAVPADRRRERLRGLHLLYAGLLGAETGSTWVTDDISSVVNWAKPGPTTISAALRTRLNEEPAALFGDRLDAVDALDAETAPLRPAGPHWYLATVGTRPDRRGEGLASLVIRAGLAACDEAGLPAAVETSNEANCRLYERLGFQPAGDRTAPDGGLRVWVLVRPARG